MRLRLLLFVSFAIALLTSAAEAKRLKAEDVVSAPDPDPEAVLADVALMGAEDHRVYVDLAKPGSSRPFVLMLDTGAAYSVLTPGKARSLGVNVRPHKSSPYRRSTLLGRDLQFWVDTTSSDTGGGTFSYGLLGGNFLQEYILELDFVNERVRFLDPRKYRLPKSVSAENEAVLKIQITSSRPYVTIERGDRKVNALFDTGAPPAVLLSGDSRKKLGIDKSELVESGRVWGVLGPTDSFSMKSSDLLIAGIPSQDMPVVVTPNGFYNQAGNTDSVVGFDWMRQFTVRIDYRRSRLWLRREIEAGQTQWYDWAAASAAYEAGEQDVESIPDPDPPLTEAEKTALREDATMSDQDRLDRWKKDTETAVFMEVEGGWVRVDGYRRRNGPKEGETWYSFEEMQALKQERAAREGDAP